ncbi:hypothetical protein L3Q82_003427 [Scortum barcoo]|uniref:Uncharacterized protein n=1 Tax=Scortum barcoo TaxID=214431 RepID=A0ACB8VM54_9TELE|nr:hypothetical protein L3Q82_003427 [Scortum barcoo]
MTAVPGMPAPIRSLTELRGRRGHEEREGAIFQRQQTKKAAAFIAYVSQGPDPEYDNEFSAEVKDSLHCSALFWSAGIIVPCTDSPVCTPIFPVKKVRDEGAPTEWSVPVDPDSQFWFAFNFNGRPYTFTRLCQGYCESPTLYNEALRDSLVPLVLSPGKKHCLVIVDMWSKWVEAFPATKQTASVVAKALLQEIMIPRWGIPTKLSSDNGTHFVNQAIQEVTGQTKSGSQAHHEQKNIKDRYVAWISVTAGPHPGARPGVGAHAGERLVAGSLPTGPGQGSARNGDVGPPSSRLTTWRKVHEGPVQCGLGSSRGSRRLLLDFCASHRFVHNEHHVRA